MAKSWYKIPAGLNRSYLDHEIKLVSALRPTPLKQILAVIGGLALVVWLCTQSFVARSGPLAITLFALWALTCVIYFSWLTPTKELRGKTVPALLAYLPRSARHVTTRRTSDPTAFYVITGISDIDADGLITFSDGTVGQTYHIVGSASYLLFDEDREAILNRVDAFWRKIDTQCEWIFVTTREPQRIFHQVSALEMRNQNLKHRHPDVIELLNEQYDILTDHVGGRFMSIHQYVIIKGKTLSGLRRGHASLQAEVEASSTMIKEAVMLDGGETQAMLAVLYQGVDTTRTGL